MATNTATYTGTSGVIKLDSVDSTAVDALASVRSFSISQAGDIIETSAMGSTSKTYLAGKTTFTGSMDVLLRDDDESQSELITTIQNGTNGPAEIELYPSGETTGIKLSGTVIITGHDIAVDQNDAVTATIAFQGSGALTKTDL
jgi:predicted secreted protein